MLKIHVHKCQNLYLLFNTCIIGMSIGSIYQLCELVLCNKNRVYVSCIFSAIVNSGVHDNDFNGNVNLIFCRRSPTDSQAASFYLSDVESKCHLVPSSDFKTY